MILFVFASNIIRVFGVSTGLDSYGLNAIALEGFDMVLLSLGLI